MAAKSHVRLIDNTNVGHKHCPVCGACLMFSAQSHNCPTRIDPEIMEVMLLDMKPWEGRRAINRIPGYEDSGGRQNRRKLQIVPIGFQEVSAG